MDLLRLAGATLNQLPLDFAGNAARIKSMLDAARAAGVELLCLPELCLTGYGCEDQFFSLSTVKKADEALRELLPATRGITVAIGLPVYYYGAMCNAIALVQDGKLLGVNCKRVLPREGVHYEPRWFRPWPFGKVVDAVVAGVKVPMGDIRYRLGTLGVAIEICEEAWDSVPASAMHADAVDVIINPSASHFALGKYAKREHLVANSSRSMQVVYLYTNLVGLEAGRMIYDGGVLVATGGELVARGPRFGFADGTLTWIDINPELASLAKLKVKPVREPAIEQNPASLRDPEVNGADPRVVAKAHAGQGALAKKPGQTGGTAAVTMSREEEFLQAEMLGLFDYLRKSHAQGFVLSLSGGCDSSTCAVLVAHMVAAAIAALGVPGVNARLALNPPLPAGSDPRAAVHRLLTCIYQKTAHSGAVTESAARDVATAIGAAFHVADVEPMAEQYRTAAAKILGRALAWQGDDTALQNIQARSRAPLPWLIANVKNALFITTSNRSEGAVGYATMDGDTAGGLAPLAGIDKRFLRGWLAWAETNCQLGLGPIAALSAVNRQAPTAELRPPGAAQTDEADLMPYDVLERIERYLVRDRLGPDDILQTLAYDFPEIPPGTLTDYLNKFFRLWAQSQWKRERLAPGFHLDDASVDPKTWCRFPIFSAPYKAAFTDGKKN
jgi:NAD+ synthase (glutamine-hydrolysing)